MKGYLLTDGAPATGWAPASRPRRCAAAVLEPALFVVTLGVGWAVWAFRLAARSTTPAKAVLGLTVYATDSRRPATRGRMLARGLVFAPLAAALGVATCGLGWLYSFLGLLGTNRRTITDEWARVIVLAPPAGDGQEPA